MTGKYKPGTVGQWTARPPHLGGPLWSGFKAGDSGPSSYESLPKAFVAKQQLDEADEQYESETPSQAFEAEVFYELPPSNLSTPSWVAQINKSPIQGSARSSLEADSNNYLYSHESEAQSPSSPASGPGSPTSPSYSVDSPAEMASQGSAHSSHESVKDTGVDLEALAETLIKDLGRRWNSSGAEKGP